MELDPRTARRAALAVAALTTGCVAVGLVLGIVSDDHQGLADVWLPASLAAAALAFAGCGALLVSRVPGNPLAWLLASIGLLEAIVVLSTGYTEFATWQVDQPRPAGAFAAWVSSWLWAPPLGILLTLVVLLFPDGKPASPRWRWAVWTAAVGILIETAGIAVSSWSMRWTVLADSNADVSPEGAWGTLAALGVLAIAVSMVAGIVSLVGRWRRARGEGRQQLRWFLCAAVLLAIGFVFALTIDRYYLVLGAAFLAIPAAVTVAVLRYRLYDLDIVVKKAVVAAIVVAVLTGVYLATLALTAGGLIGGLLIALTFRPVLEAARRIADRLIYGKRATPYEVLADFSARVAGTYVDEDVLQRMAELLRAATGADVARMWLDVGGVLRDVARAPVGAGVAEEAVDAVPIEYRGEVLGAISVAMPPNDPIDPGRTRLIHDLAGQAGPVLANVRLIAELRASRRRIVSAQDARAKKLERDIHDGAQQQLIALAIKLRLLEQVASRDPGRVVALSAELQRDAADALDNLRDLARGIYPPILADQGLGAAISAQARKAPLPVAVETDGVGRYEPEIEAAVYFSVLEALQNIAKYAEASGASVRLSTGDRELRFEISDDGRGFDPAATGYGSGLQGIADRMAAVGGQTQVRSAPGAGTTVTGRVPTEPVPVS